MTGALNLALALQTAQKAALQAAEVIRGFYRQGTAINHKSDDSPVTQADVEAELAIKSVLKQQFPEHGFYGEETGTERMDAEYLWLIDPIDGTKSFVRNYPIFSTQIALMHQGRLILGVSMASEFQQMAFAYEGGGAWLADSLDVSSARRVSVAEDRSLSQAIVSTGNVKTLSKGPGWQQLAHIAEQAYRLRGYGDFYHYHLLAQGSLDLVIESDVNILDIAALAVIVREAGGVFSDLSGQPLGLDTRSVLAGTPALHAYAQQLFSANFAHQLQMSST